MKLRKQIEELRPH